MNRLHKHIWWNRLVMIAIFGLQLTIVFVSEKPSYFGVFFTGITAGIIASMIIEDLT